MRRVFCSSAITWTLGYSKGMVDGGRCRWVGVSASPISDFRAGFFCVLGFSGVLGWNLDPLLDNVGFTCTLNVLPSLFFLVYFSEIYFAFCQDPGNKICHMVLLMTNHILSVGLFVVHGSCRPARQGFMICNWSRFWRIKMRRLIRDMELIVPAQIKQR